VLFLYWIHFVFPLVVDICVLQPPIDTLGETASASQVFLKGPIVRACWCALGYEPWVYLCANRDPPRILDRRPSGEWDHRVTRSIVSDRVLKS
jgi:hypothetical protein